MGKRQGGGGGVKAVMPSVGFSVGASMTWIVGIGVPIWIPVLLPVVRNSRLELIQ